MIDSRPTAACRAHLSTALACALLTALAGCATTEEPTIRHAPLDALPAARAGTPASATGTGAFSTDLASGRPDGLAPTLRPGTGQVINNRAAASPPAPGGSAGEASFSFDGASLNAVVKAILGDLLQQNYVIAPTVQGTVTLSARGVNPDQALSLLEMALSWNNARLIYSEGRYTVVPTDQALPGNLAPRTGGPGTARGYEVRAVPLRFVSATEMEKLLKPYARKESIVSADNARSLIVLAGSRAELENYLRTVQIFDVDWMASMSTGLFPLQSADAIKVAEDLEKAFGADSKTPIAGMFRFLPLEGSNSVLVITPQPKYLRDIESFIRGLDSSGEQPRLYTYEVKYMKAQELAEQLGNAFGASVTSTDSSDSASTNSLMPSLDPVQARSINTPAADAADPRARATFEASRARQRNGSGGDDGLAVGSGKDVSFSAVEETNTVLVRAAPAQWDSIRRAMERMDVMPLQVHIEAQIAEVTLSGNLQYGVSWFLSDAQTDIGSSLQTGTVGSGDGSFVGTLWNISHAGWSAVLRALDNESNVKLLSTPSVTVRNNVEAELKVGTNIPITSTTIGTIDGGTTGNSSLSSVQYLETGVILKVTPRISPDGLVFLEISQEVSSAGDTPQGADNPPINTRNLLTEAAVQDGETVLLAGLISDSTTNSSGGIPYLSRMPVLGGLFGNRTQGKSRQEVIIMITPTVIRDPREARSLTEEYGRRFRDITPLVLPPATPLPRSATPAGVPRQAPPAQIQPLRPSQAAPVQAQPLPQR